jgi:2-methylcitrate dehydratase PrpD
VTDRDRYRLAFVDWLACAARGSSEPAAHTARAAADGLTGRVAAAGCAGHVLDYDDTYAPGLVHASAPVAPVVLLLAAERGIDLDDALGAYAAGFEATAALARAGHPALYERGWHPTAVCGTVGAAVGAARLLGLEPDAERAAAALAALRAAGLQAAFGTEGKALQVGLAGAAGLEAARLVGAGARVDPDKAGRGFEAAYGGTWELAQDEPAIRENWIKAHPCCLVTHAAIEAAEELRQAGRVPDGDVVVTVHPTARRAAHHDDATDGLQAKFSFPYTTAHTLMYGPPTVDSFAAPDERARSWAAAHVRVRTDAALEVTEARIEIDGVTAAAVRHAPGSPQHPMDEAALARKVEQLAPSLLEAVGDGGASPATLAQAAGLA